LETPHQVWHVVTKGNASPVVAGTSDAVNRAVAEHVRDLRARLAAGRDEIARQRRVLDETREHIDEMSRWVAATERHLREQRGRGTDVAA
jgi:hypothetical protein